MISWRNFIRHLKAKEDEVKRLNDLDRALKMLNVEPVENPEIVERLETRRGGGRESKIREFLMNAEIGKWYRIAWNIGAVYREAKKANIKVKATVLNNERYVKILERP
jgi:hypothetical protein